MKLVLIAVVALVLGVAGGTAFTVMRAPKRPAIVAKAPGRDSTHVAARPVVPPAPVGSSAPPAAPTVVAAAHTSPVQVTPLPPGPVATAPGAAAATAAAAIAAAEADTANGAGYQQLGRIFGKMQTADAVKIMSFLGDDEVSRVLGTLNVRQAAALLAALPSERAARLSKRMIEPSTRPATAGAR